MAFGIGLPMVSTVFSSECCGTAGLKTIYYALLLVLNSMLSWLFVAEWFSTTLQSLTFGWINNSCNGATCLGSLAIHRFGLALSIFHLSIVFIILGLKASNTRCLAVHNNYWRAKLFLWIILVAATFSIPDAASQFWGVYVAPVGAVIFLIFGLIVTIDVAHTWVEKALKHVEQADSYVWQAGLILITTICYSLCIISTITMYLLFAREGCVLNQYSITANLILSIIVSLASIMGIVQEYNYYVGLGQASLISLYCTYLVFSAVVMAPSHDNCNPVSKNNNTQKISATLGAFFAFLTIAFTTARTASSDPFGPVVTDMTVKEDDHALEAISYKNSSPDLVHKSAMQIILKSNKLSENDLPTTMSNNNYPDAEVKQDSVRTIYQLLFFHTIFLLSVCWTGTWLSLHVTKEHNSLEAVSRAYWTSWIKVLSSELCYCLYILSLILPVYYTY